MEKFSKPQTAPHLRSKANRKNVLHARLWQRALRKYRLLQLWKHGGSACRIWARPCSWAYHFRDLRHVQYADNKRRHAYHLRWNSGVRTRSDIAQILSGAGERLSHRSGRQPVRACCQSGPLFFPCRKSRYDNNVSSYIWRIPACNRQWKTYFTH